MQKSHDLTKKQLIEIVIVTTILGFGILLYDFVNTNFDGIIKRKDAGKGILSEELRLEFLDQTKDFKVDVSDRRLSDSQIEASFDKAIAEIEDTYLGENKDANNVTYDINLRSEYVDGLISARWKTSPYGIISSDGKLKVENIPEDGELINIIGTLYYEEDKERVYSFSVLVKRKSIDTVDGQLEAINRAVVEKDLASREKDYFKLPGKVEGIKLNWKRKMDFRGLKIILLGIAAVLALMVGKNLDKKKEAVKRVEEMEKDYPLIVNQLSILMGAGMSFRNALERIVNRYVESVKGGGNKRPGFEEILKTYRKIVDGRGERQALEELGKTCECKEYRKLSMLLVQNLKKGSKDLLDSLEKEEANAFEMRKQRAKRLGEEASTKLLIPLAGMLFIVIVVLVVPALMQVN